MKNYHRSYVPGKEERKKNRDTEGKKPNTKGADVQVYLGHGSSHPRAASISR